MGIRTSSHIAKAFHAHNAKDDYRKVVLFPEIQEPPSHCGLLMIIRLMRSFALSGVAFRTKQSLNPVDRGHIAFRTDDIEAFKAMLREKNIPFADYGVWAMGGWYQIFLQDPDGTIIEVHQADYKPGGDKPGM